MITLTLKSTIDFAGHWENNLDRPSKKRKSPDYKEPTPAGMKRLPKECGLDLAKMSEADHQTSNVAKRYKRQVQKTRYALKLAQRQKGPLKKLAKRDIIAAIEELLKDTPGQKFLTSQISNHGRKPKGRKYSRQDKAFALGIFKRSRAAYLWTAQHLILPFETTLKRIVAKVAIEPGISPILIKTSGK